MCHTDAPGYVAPDESETVAISLPTGEVMPALLAAPAGGRGPAVVVVSDIFGVSRFYEDLAGRVARAGFVALCPNVFFREGDVEWGDIEGALARREQLDEHRTLDDLAACVAFLRSHPQVVGPRVGTMGFCLGGTFVLDLSARDAKLATACFYGFPAPEPGAGAKTAPAPLTLSDQINGPLIGFWGSDDHRVRTDDVRQLQRELEVRGVEVSFTIYPDVGHGFFVLAGDEGPEHDAAVDAWTETLSFFGSRLRGDD